MAKKKAETITMTGLSFIIVVASIFLDTIFWNIFVPMLKSSFPALNGTVAGHLALAKLALLIQMLACIPLIITIMKNNWRQENIVSFYAISLIDLLI